MNYTQQDIEDNMGLVYREAHKSRRKMTDNLVEFDDLVGAGTLGLIYALERFNPEQGNRFSSYACKCIWGHIMHWDRELYKERWKSRDAGEHTFTVSFYHEDVFGNFRGDHDRKQGERDLTSAVNLSMIKRNMQKILTPRQLTIVEALLENDLNYIEVAKELGCTKQNVHLHWTNALKRLRRGGVNLC